MIISMGENVYPRETEEQAARIRDLGGNVIQGYLFSKPMSESDFEHGLAYC